MQHAFISVSKPGLCHRLKFAIDHRVIEINRISGYLKIELHTFGDTAVKRTLKNTMEIIRYHTFKA